MRSTETARLLLDGWLVHYNFFRPHEALKDKTPAEKAGIKTEYKNWLDVVHRPVVAVTKSTEPLVIYSVPAMAPRVTLEPRLSALAKPTKHKRGIFISQARGGGLLMSRRPVRGTKLLKRIRI